MIQIRLRKFLHAAHGEMTLTVDVEVGPGEFLAIMGPSGSGKTTLLRLIAGLMRPEEGFIQFNRQTWLDTQQHIYLPTQRRRVGLVFQDYALFPNMTVRENLTFALEKKQAPDIVEELIEIMEIRELVHRNPATLSGGQQQRVALARALVRQPNLLLLDEPLSALDPEMRAKLQDYILHVHERFRLTTLLVSHNEDEIRKMADRVLRLEEGKIVEIGPVKEVLSQEGTSWKSRAQILEILENGQSLTVQLQLGGARLELDLPINNRSSLEVGDRVWVWFEEGKFRVG